MQTLRVELGERSYDIAIGKGLLQEPTHLAREVAGRDVLVITNTVVGPLYCDALQTTLAAAGAGRIIEAVLPDGEQHKTLANAARMFDILIANRMARDALIVALGGGVVGDLAGFAAACYQRGIGFIQVPTTLLADVDSSVGGKTAVNHPGGKNMIGAFHQPRAVLVDTGCLDTLPDRELRAGLAEVIKYGLGCDAELFGWLEQHLAALLGRESQALAHAIHRSCAIKAAIVGRDERESGERALLNLGHTFGHAIETATGYTQWLHGEAVGMGLLLATDMSVRMGLVDAQILPRLRALLQAAGLPTAVPRLGAARALALMSADKKVQSRRIRLVLLRQLGAAEVTADYPDALLEATLDAWFG